MVYNFISLCISVLSVSSVVKQEAVEITFNRRDHRGHRDTRRTFAPYAVKQRTVEITFDRRDHGGHGDTRRTFVYSAVKQETVKITFNRRDHGGHREHLYYYTIFILITPLIDHVIFYTVII
jgi:hypothetical protein